MNVMGIPLGGLDVVVHPRHGLTSQVYSLNTLEEKLIDFGNEFQKVFIIFACATILAPNSKFEGIHNLWDLIWDGKVDVHQNLSKKFQSGNGTYIHVQLFALPTGISTFSELMLVNNVL